MVGDAVVGNGCYHLAGVNIVRLTDCLVQYTRAKYTTTPTNRYGTEVTVKNGYVTGVVDRSVGLTDPGPRPVPVDGYVLSGHGKAKTFLNTYAKIGTRVRVPPKYS